MSPTTLAQHRDTAASRTADDSPVRDGVAYRGIFFGLLLAVPLWGILAVLLLVVL